MENPSHEAKADTPEPSGKMASREARPGPRTFWPLYRFRRLSLRMKILAVNAAVLLLGTACGTYLARQGVLHSWTLAILFFSASAAAMIIANYVAFLDHFRQLAELSRALEAIRRGKKIRRELAGPEGASVVDLLASVNRLLARLDDGTLQLSARLLGSIEVERQRIANELHDDVSQLLAAAMLKLDLALKRLPSDPAATQQALASARELLTTALTQLRTVIHDLRPATLDHLGLPAALRSYIKARADRPGLEVVTRFDVGEERLAPHVETALYRVAQEALANAVRHADAPRIEVTLEVRPGFAALSVIDNGQGFALAEASGWGLGLLSMRERVGLLGGTFNIVTAPGQGTRIYAVIPRAEAGGGTEEGKE